VWSRLLGHRRCGQRHRCGGGASAAPQGCTTDGCVFRKQAEFHAVVAAVKANDECASVVDWTQSIAQEPNGTFSVVCGDTSSRKTFSLRVDNPDSSTDPSKITVADAGTTEGGPTVPEDECHTDGCVTRKQAEFDAVLKWADTTDDCSSAVSWIQAVRKTNETTYSVTCGDSSPEQFVLHVDNPKSSTDPADVVVTLQR
jgi:hypothetical protein